MFRAARIAVRRCADGLNKSAASAAAAGTPRPASPAVAAASEDAAATAARTEALNAKSTATSSTTGLAWLRRKRYGTEAAPYLGVFHDTKQDNGSHVKSADKLYRENYIKALLYVAGEGRRARDWVSGWACVNPSLNALLLPLILQHKATLDDFHVFVADTYKRDLPPAQQRQLLGAFFIDCAACLSFTCHQDKQCVVRERYYECGSLAGMRKEWLDEVAQVALQERDMMADKFNVLDPSSTHGDNV